MLQAVSYAAVGGPNQVTKPPWSSTWRRLDWWPTIG
jgi:hypothetical protein